MAKYNSKEEFYISLGIDVNSDDAKEKIEVVDKVLKGLGDTFNKELDIKIDSSNIDEVLDQMNKLDAKIQSVVNNFGQLSKISVNFSSKTGNISTFQADRLVEFSESLKTLRAGEILPLNYSVSHKQGGDYSLDQVIKQYKEIESLNQKMLSSDKKSDTYNYYAESIEKAKKRLQEFIDTQAKSFVSQEQLNEAERKFNYTIQQQNKLYKAKDFDKEFKKALAEEAKQHKEYTQYLEREAKVIERLDKQEEKLSKQYEAKQHKEYAQYLEKEARAIEQLDKQEEKLSKQYETKQLNQRIEDIKQLTNQYTKYLSEKEKVDSSTNEYSKDYYNYISTSLSEITKKLENYGVSFDESSKKIEESFSSSKLEIDKTTESYKDLVNIIEKANKKIEENRANQSQSEYNKQVKSYIEDLNKLYKAQSSLQKMEFAGAKPEDLIEQRNLVQDLKEKTNSYTDEVKNNKDAIAQLEKNTQKLSQEQKDLVNNINRTGVSFGSFSKKIKEVINNVSLYGILYKTFDRTTDLIVDSIEKIHELDTSMTNIQLVTGQTDEETRQLVNTYADMAKTLGSTTQEVINGSIEWLRQGKTVEDTNKLLKASTMLSKLGMIESADATEKLTAIMNGYKLSADKAVDTVSKLVNIDLIAATSSEELATSLQYVASFANSANVSLDKMIGLISVGSETTRLSAETIGQGWKSIFSRLENVKAGKDIDDLGESINDTEKVLSRFNIKLRDTSDEFRSMEDVIDEVGTKWNEFSSVEQAQIATAIAGTYQRNTFIATMENYSKVLKYASESANSAGVAEQKYADVLDSIDAKINNLISTWDKLINNLNATGVFGDIVDLGTNLVEVLDVLINKFGLIKFTGGTIIIASLLKIAQQAKKVVVSLSEISNVSNSFNEIRKSAENFEKSVAPLGQILRNLNNSEKALILSTQNLTRDQAKQILIASGLSNDLAEQTLQTVRLSTTQKAATASTFSLSSAFKGLGIAIAANPIGAAITAISLAIGAFSIYTSQVEEKTERINQLAEDVKNTYTENVGSIDSGISEIQELSEEYEQLSKGVDQYGRNISLTSDEYDRYKEIVETLIKYNPELQDGYIAQNGLIVDQKNAIEDTVEALEKKRKIELFERTSLENISTILTSYKDTYQELNDEISDSTFNVRESLSKLIGLDFELPLESKNFAENYIKNVLGIKNPEEIKKYIENYNKEVLGTVYFDFNKFISDNSEGLYENLDKIMSSYGISEANEAIRSEYLETQEYIQNLLTNTSKRESFYNDSLREEFNLVAQLNDNYKNLDATQKQFLDSYISQINFEDLIDSDGNIIKPLISETKAGINQLIDILSSNETSQKLQSVFDAKDVIPADEWANQAGLAIDNILDELNITDDDERLKLKVSLGLNNEELSQQVTLAKSKIIETFSGIFDNEDIVDLTKLPLDQLMYVYENLEKFSGLSFEGILQQLDMFEQGLDSTVSKLTNIELEVEKVSESLEDLDNAYNTLSKAVDEYNSTGTLTIDTLNSLLSTSDEYLQYLTEENGQLVLNKEGMNNLAKARIEDTQALLAQKIATISASQADAVKALTTETAEQAELNLRDALGEVASGESTYTEALSNMATANSELINSIAGISAVEGLDESLEQLMGSSFWEYSENAKNAYQSQMDLLEGLKGNVGSIFSYSSGGSAGSSTDPWKEEFESLYKELQYQRDMDIIDSMSYYQQLDALNQKYFANNKTYLDEYRQYNKEVYQGINQATKDEFNTLYQDLQYQRDMDLIDAETYYQQLAALTQKYFSNSKQFLSEYRKYSQEVFQGLKQEAENREKERAQAEIDAINSKIDALQKEKEELQEVYEQEDLNLKLQKARDRYEAAKGQLNTRVYTQEQGWVWQADSEEVEAAKEEVESIEKEIERNAALKAIDDQIEALEDLREDWQDYMNNIEIGLEELGLKIDENGNIVFENGELINQVYQDMMDSTNQYGLTFEDNAYMIQNSLNDISSTLQRMSSEDMANVFNSTNEPINNMIQLLNQLIAALNTYITAMNNARNVTVSGYTEMNTSANNYLLKTQQLRDEFIQSYDNMSTRMNTFIDEMSNFVYQITEYYRQMKQAHDDFTSSTFDALIEKMRSFVESMAVEFNNLETSIYNFQSTVSQVSTLIVSDLNAMSIAAENFAIVMENVQARVVNALLNIQQAAQAALQACLLAEQAAIRAEEAAIKAADNAKKALLSAMEAEESAIRAENAAISAAASAEAAAASADSAESSAARAAAAAASAAASAASAAASASGIGGGGGGVAGMRAAGGSPSDTGVSSGGGAYAISIVNGVPERAYASGIEKGAVKFTGPAWLDGTPSNPEYVLTSNQMENFVRNMSRSVPQGITNNNSNISEDNDSFVIQNCTFPINNVRNPNDFQDALKQIAKQNRK